MTGLAVPLSIEQIAAADRIRRRMPNWRRADRALHELAMKFPDFGGEASLLKAVTVNSLYATNIYAIARMAAHVADVMAGADRDRAGPELVERLAELPASPSGKQGKRFHSFASKFAHFFVDPEKFPILDAFAEGMVKVHLGRSHFVRDEGGRYFEFFRNFETLKRLAGLSVSNPEIDRYLWVAGAYRAWRKNPRAKMASEAKNLFENASPQVLEDLRILADE